MRIVDVRWTDKVNIAKILCDCGTYFEFPVNRVRVVCPCCDRIGNMHRLKAEEIRID